MDTFFENARRILDVAANGASEGPDEFALLIRPDGGLHMLMNQPFRLDSAAAETGAAAAYRVVRSSSGVRVEGHAGGQDCVLQTRTDPVPGMPWLRDQPLYKTTCPLLTSTASS